MGQNNIKPGTVLDGFHSLIFSNSEEGEEHTPVIAAEAPVTPTDRSRFVKSAPAAGSGEAPIPPTRGVFRPKP